jgi:hypothetical protein
LRRSLLPTVSFGLLVPALSELVALSRSLTDLTSPDLARFTSLLLRTVDPALRDARAPDAALCRAVLVPSADIALMLAGFFTRRRFHGRLLAVLRAGVVAVRHVPPPWFARCPAAVALFLPSGTADTRHSSSTGARRPSSA